MYVNCHKSKISVRVKPIWPENYGNYLEILDITQLPRYEVIKMKDAPCNKTCNCWDDEEI